MTTSRSLTAESFGRRLAACLPDGASPHALAVACSGGPDSLALALLARDWARAAGVRLQAFIVDHGLRPESAEEAAAVCARLRDAGVAAEVLCDPDAVDGPPGADIQAAARRLRYRLLLQACAQAGIGTLALAHHQEDQAETFLLRLARGSGVDGLSAMAPAREWATDWGGVRIVRPLLDVAKADLAARVAAEGLSAVDDPSNRNPRFDRVRMRQAQADLSALGLTPARLAETARRMGRARAALEAATDDLLSGAAAIDPAGFARLDLAPLRAAPEEIGLRALARLVRQIGGAPYPPRLERLERLYGALLDGSLGGGRTLAGVRLASHGAERLLIHREVAQIREAAPVTPHMLWDGRFRLRFAAADPSVEVRALGRDGWSQLRRRDPQAGRAGEALPGPVRVSLPALWPREEGAGPLGAPHLATLRGALQPIEIRFAGPQVVRLGG